MGTDLCDCVCGDHHAECLEKNQAELDAIPSSPLYKCKKCQKQLKLWPVEKLSKTKCFKCDGEKYDNDGTNVHVCFTCEDWNMDLHLCSKHHRGQEVIEVDFEEKSSIYEALEEKVEATKEKDANEDAISLMDVENPEEPSAPTAPSRWTGLKNMMSARAALLKHQSNPSTIVDLTSEDMRYTGRRFKRMVSSDAPPPPTYEEVVAM